jgi:hypothetical protein
MDFSKLRTSDWVVGGSGVALLIFSFFPWYGVEGLGGGSRSGWDYFLFGTIPVLIGIAMVAIVLIRAMSPDTKLPELPIGWGQVLFIAGCVAAALVVLKLLIGDDVLGFDLDRKIGIFLSALAAIGLAVGGFLQWQEEKGGATTTGTTPPQPF